MAQWRSADAYDGDKDKLKGKQGRDQFFADMDDLDSDDDKLKDNTLNQLDDLIHDLT